MGQLTKSRKLNGLVKQGSKYTDDQRINAAILYAVKGVYAVVTRELGIPKATLSNWSETAWWLDVVNEVRTEKRAEHRAKYVEIIDKAQEQTLQALPKATAQQAVNRHRKLTLYRRRILTHPESVICTNLCA